MSPTPDTTTSDGSSKPCGKQARRIRCPRSSVALKCSMSCHQAYRTLLTAIVAGVVASCDLSTRELAEENTSYSSGLLKSGPSCLTDIRADMSVKEVFDRIGTPLWVSDFTGGANGSRQGSELSDSNLSAGKWRLWYSKQKDPRLDFIRVTIIVEEDKVIEIENAWYRE